MEPPVGERDLSSSLLSFAPAWRSLPRSISVRLVLGGWQQFPGDVHSVGMSVPVAPPVFWETVWGPWVVLPSALGGGDFEVLVIIQFYLSQPGTLFPSLQLLRSSVCK